MATNTSRSQNAELAEGATDGKYKKIVTDRGVAESTTYESRRDLHDAYYGLHEAKQKELGDGTAHVTPDFTPTPAVTGGFYFD